MIFYIGIIAYSDFSKFTDKILSFKFELLPIILLLTFCAILIKGIRQNILLKKIDIKISIKDNLLLYLAGLSMAITPGSGGEVIKSYFLKKKFGYKAAKTLPLVFVERFYDLISIVSVILFSLIFIQINEILIISIIIIILLILVYLILRIKKLFSAFIKIFIKINFFKKFTTNILEYYDSINSMTSKKSMTQSWIISILSWSVDLFAVYLIYVGFGLDFEILFTTLITFSSFLFGALTLVPLGVGVTEISLLKFLTESGVDLSLGTAIIVMIRLRGIWFATIIGFIASKSFLGEQKNDI